MAAGIKVNCRALLKRMSEADQTRLNDAVDNYADEPVNEAYKYALNDLIETLEGQKAEIMALAKAKGQGSAVQTASGQASTVSELEDVLRDKFGKLFSKLPLKIVQSVSDLPDRPDIKVHPKRTRGMYFQGQAFIVADNVAPREAWGLAMHEVGVHAGMENLLGSSLWNKVKQDFRRKVEAGDEAFVVAMDRVPDTTNPNNKLEEGIAYLVEMSPDLPLVKRIIAAIRQWIYRTFNGRFIDLNENDLREMAVAALRAEGVKRDEVIYSGLGRWYYSPLKRAVETSKQESMPADQWNKWIESNKSKLGIKSDEIQWSGLTDWLELQGKNKVTRGQIAEYLEGNGVKVEEVELGSNGQASEAMRRALTGEASTEVSYSPTEWMEHSARFERTARSWQRNGDDQQAEKYFALAEEAARLAEGLGKKGSTRGMPKFQSYQLPGGENYRELLLRLPSEAGISYKMQALQSEMDIIRRGRLPDNMTAEENARFDDVLADYAALKKKRDTTFTSSHFPEHMNILAHIRFNERTDANGKRVLFIEEMQSDWAQMGRKDGFRYAGVQQRAKQLREAFNASDWAKTADEEGRDSVFILIDNWVAGVINGNLLARKLEEKGVPYDVVGRIHDTSSGTPSAPFVTDTKAWVALALKRMIRYAAENGFDRVAWTNGDQQADRYDLSKHIKSIDWRWDGQEVEIQAYTLDGNPISMFRERDTLDEAVGKDIAAKINAAIDAGEDRAIYTGLDLKVGGEGMNAFYDRIVPQVANDLLKKLGGGKVGEIEIVRPNAARRDEILAEIEAEEGKPRRRTSRMVQPGFDISPEMRDKALQGLPLFSLAQEKTAPRIRGENIPDKIEYNKSVIWQAIQDESKEVFDKGLERLVFMSDLMSIAVNKGLTKAKGFNILLDSKSQTRSKIMEQVAALAQRGYDLKDSVAAREFIRQSTRAEKWGYEPTWKKGVVVDPVLAAKYTALSHEAQQVVDDVFKHSEDIYTRKQHLINKSINDEYDELLAMTDDPKEKIQIENDRATRIAETGRMLPKLQGPYAPLKRFGNYAVVGKSAEFMQAEEDHNIKAIRRMEADPKHHWVEFVDTLWEAKARARQLKDFYDFTEGTTRQKLSRQLQEVPWASIAKLKNAIAEMDGGAKYKQSMQTLATDLYLTMLAESSARKSELHRKGIAGEEKDMFRAISSQGQADAHFIAALQDNDAINKKILEMQDEAAHGEKGNRHDRTRVLNEILARYAQAIDYRPTPFVDQAKGLTSFWMLVMSPSYYIQNSTQPFMLTAPVLSGKFGAGPAWSALWKAYKDVISYAKNMTHALDIDAMPISAGEKTMLKNMRDQGKLDLSLAMDLERFAEGRPVDGNFGKVMQKIWALPQKVEMLNRITSALAAYRLSGGDEAYVGKEILDNTHGNYAASNAPRFVESSGAAKLIFQFRKFQLIQLSLLARLARNSFKGATPEEKAIARRALTWLIGQHMLMTGVMGMPIPAIAWMMFAAFGGDEDEPKDAERLMREWIGNENVSNLLLRGLPAFLGMDVSQRIGMSQATALLPFVDLDPSRKGYEKALVGASGPFLGGLVPQIIDGIDLMGKGDYYKGIEATLPKGLKDTLRAYRQATEGVTLRNGDVVMPPDEINLIDSLATAAGLPTMKLSERQRRQKDVIEFEQYYRERASEIKHDYTKAYKDADSRGMEKAKEEWLAVQESKKRNGFKPQPLNLLTKSPQEQMKRERQVIEGLEYKDSNRAFVEEEADI